MRSWNDDQDAATFSTDPHVRSPQRGIPAEKVQRERLRSCALEVVREVRLVPPAPLADLLRLGELACQRAGIDPTCREYAAILVNNAVWQDAVLAVPYDKRLLLLPQCLRSEGRCEATIDEFGLLCAGCGRCAIHALTEEAESLGYAVLVAEGSTLVTKMIETGRIRAIIGVSCMSVLEKCFPHMEARAVPGLAIPLLFDGCKNTALDVDWLRSAIYASVSAGHGRLQLDDLKRHVEDWFAPAALDASLGPPDGTTEQIAREWLARAGKRWRPYLTACVYLALCDAEPSPSGNDSDLVKLAIAVECFHKASLIHDDIEDDDETRYGRETLHREHGVPVALNVGDFLLGEGYRLIGELNVPDDVKVALYRIAAEGHRTLSRGQGAELCWRRRPTPLEPADVLEIFRLKTAPAFEVALRFGAELAGVSAEIHEVLRRYSDALGIAYQIRDDLEDFRGNAAANDLREPRPSVVLAVADKHATPAERSQLRALWLGRPDNARKSELTSHILDRLQVEEPVKTLLTRSISQAVQSLTPLNNAELKGLLRRIIGKIFGDEPLGDPCALIREHRPA